MAIELRLHIPNARTTPALATMVKDYIDLLIGSVIVDDSRVDHLIVLRHAAAAERTEVTVRCLPVSIFAAEFDRAFRTLGQRGAIASVTPDSSEFPAAPFLDAAPNPAFRWGLTHFDAFQQARLRHDEGVLNLLDHLDDEEEEQLAEDPDAWVDLDIPAAYAEFADRDTRDSTRTHLEHAIGLGRGDWLSDQGFDARDRPGPAPPWISETVERDLADILQLPDTGPGCFLLPPPPEQETAPGEVPWQKLIVQKIASQGRQGPWHRARFRGPVVIDIALRGKAGRRHDVDNLAHKVVRAMERAFGPELPLDGYRVYRKAWPRNDLRVRLMPKIRLEALAASMDEARKLARAERPARARE